MEFSRRKLSVEEAPEFSAIPISDVKPFGLMWAPVYVFMKRNEKYVSVKAPLDFFVPEELDRLKSFTHFYLPEFTKRVEPFIEAGKRVREVLGWNPDDQPGSSPAPEDSQRYPPVRLSPAPYELSDAVLRIIGPLWGDGYGLESFFVAALVDELCDGLDQTRLLSGRDRDVTVFERAIFVSGWAVFLALHLGHTELGFLRHLRERAFDSVTGAAPGGRATGESGEIIAVAEGWVEALATAAEPVRIERVREGKDRVSLKMTARFERVIQELADRNAPRASIAGSGGFIDG